MRAKGNVVLINWAQNQYFATTNWILMANLNKICNESSSGRQ